MAEILVPKLYWKITMTTAIKILTMIIMVAAALRAILQSITVLRALPINEVIIEVGKFLRSIDWL